MAARGSSEILIIEAECRRELARKAAALANVLQGRDDLRLADVAYTLAAGLNGQPSILAIVASSIADGAKKLQAAAARLEKPDCHLIRDAAGVYFADQPLARNGELAFLFPGEGAQYLDMLGDLAPRFSVIREHLRQVDHQSTQWSARGEALSQLLCAPAEWDAETRKRAELEFNDLGTAMFGVLVADWCIHLTLDSLGVHPSAMAGHSMGEFAALTAAGAVDPEATPLSRIVQTIESLEKDGRPTSAPATRLIAVGLGRAELERIAKGMSLADVFVGMDNCPHQSIAVGAVDTMTFLEAELKRRGTLYETLPFNRPYHTPLFLPWRGVLESMFDAAAFSRPKVRVYSATTALPFPDDPRAIAELAVAHWFEPVAFTDTIRRMHDDGVRIFVEAGPRGNLTAFVEDILRGREFVAAPANVQRRSGLLQFNHLLAQLAAHGVKIRWDRLYAEREVAGTELSAASTNHSGLAEAKTAAATDEGSSDFAESVDFEGAAETGTDEQSEVMKRYLDVMSDFLDLQSEVMNQYLSESFVAQPATMGRAVNGDGTEGEAPQDSIGQSNRPLLGQVVSIDPGRSLIARKRLCPDEIRFAADHTVGGRRVSRVDPHQHGLPVMPMTGSLETMAEHAELLAPPGFQVIAIENVRLARWLAVDDPPHAIEIRAFAVDHASAAFAVQVEVHDLGAEGKSEGSDEGKLAARGIVLLAAERPAPPMAEPFNLTNERPSRISIEVLYRNLFHGESFQGVLSMPRIGEEGIEARIETMDRSFMFGGPSEPNLILDPVLLDVVMHPLAAWHLEQPDQRGRILLPIGLKRIEIYASPLEKGARLTSRGRILSESARHFVKSFDAIDAEGRVLFRFDSVQYWRFYVPFGEVNFHGPKDEYFLSQRQEMPPEAMAMAAGKAVPDSANTSVKKVHDGVPRASLMWFDPPLDIRQPVIRGAAAKVTLSKAEFDRYRLLELPEAEIDRWLFTRIAIKDAARQLWFERHGKRHFPADLVVDEFAPGQFAVHWREPEPQTASDYRQDMATELPKVDAVSFGAEALAIAGYFDRVGLAAIHLDDATSIPETTTDDRQALQSAGLAGDWPRRLWLARRAAARAFNVGEFDFTCKDIDVERSAVLLQNGETIAAATFQINHLLIAMVLA